MKENRVTIFTPTYNRDYILHQCYKSLCHQSNKNFVWLIVDDGSTDSTELLVKNWIGENKIHIEYIKQKNSGKHAAHNTGVLACKTKIFVCVDSDDYLTNNAVQRIYDIWEKIKNDAKIAGIVALKGCDENTPVRTSMPSNVETCSISELYRKHKFKGDTILIFKTEILKNNLFPIFEGEKFVTEAVIYDVISRKYKMYLLNEILYVCKYLPDGYSFNLLKVHRESPKGYIHYLTNKINFSKSFSERYDAYASYIAGCWRIEQKIKVIDQKHRIVCIISIPKAMVIHIKPYIKSTFDKIGIFKMAIFLLSTRR